ncbi:hypothetical protein BFW01_g7883 [Lasiodiplodia theobromae]|nr:hypothetical protein BFW01_g7883 [Lasiodiplodia theobromae]
MDAGSKQPKKVRLACERCRDRRIKCDGKVPACENCSKAQVPCIDVDTRTSAGRISRAFQHNAAARIEWLESIIRTRLPDVDLSAGPPLLNTETVSPAPPQEQSQPTIGQNRGVKRSHSAPGQEHGQSHSVEQSARSMALHLGLLSLDVNSSQVHYLGSSSGSLFTPMLRANQEDPASLFPASSNEPSVDGSQADPFTVYEQIEESRLEQTHVAQIHRLYAMLRTDLPSRRDCSHLTNMFFRHFHAEYPFLHRPTIECMTDALYHCSDVVDETSFQYNGWPASQQWFPCNGEDAQNLNNGKQIAISVFAAATQLFLILGISANLKTQKRDYQYDPTKFHEAAKAALDPAISKISLHALQIILLLVLRSFTSTERSNTWATVHLGMAFAVELGLHRDASSCDSFSEAAHQMRRRVFYCMYSLERRLSAIQGRPIGFSDDTLDTSLPKLIEISPSDLKAVADQSYLPFSIQIFKIAQLVSRIKHTFYLLPKTNPGTQTEAALRDRQEELRTELDCWDAECPRAVQCIPQQERGLPKAD